MAIGKRPGNNVCFVVLAVPHDIGLDLWCFGQENLAPRGIALGILDARQCSCGIAGAVEHDPRAWVSKGCLQVWQFLADECDAVLISQPVM